MSKKHTQRELNKMALEVLLERVRFCDNDWLIDHDLIKELGEQAAETARESVIRKLERLLDKT